MKAIALDNREWRYYKLLAESYIRHQKNDSALMIAKKFYSLHTSNYIMGMLYAKTLLLNKQYATGDQLLSGLNIIPFEGATEGRELYREAKLMLALQQFKNKKYKKSLAFIRQARQWPLHLGVGKPYEEDVDERLEDWLTHLCYEKMVEKKPTETFLQKIIHFRPRIENTVRNFIAANTLVTMWALEKSNGKDKAENWLSEQTEKFPDNKSLLWVKEIFQSNKSGIPDMEKDASMRIFEELENLEQ